MTQSRHLEAKGAPADARISCTAVGSNAIVSAPGAGYRIRVLSYLVIAAGGPQTITWLDGSTTKSGALPLTTNTGAAVNFSPVGHFDCSDNAALNLSLNTSTHAVHGHLRYQVVQ